MQTQRNTISNTILITKEDFLGANGQESEYSKTTGNNTKGPLTVLNALENATKGWINVNDQTYTMGTTVFKTNAFTGCSSYNSCNENTYTLASRTAKARMVTAQEVAALGCTSNHNSCPRWMFGINENYWTMSMYSLENYGAWCLYSTHLTYGYDYIKYNIGARAVVVVSK